MIIISDDTCPEQGVYAPQRNQIKIPKKRVEADSYWPSTLQQY